MIFIINPKATILTPYDRTKIKNKKILVHDQGEIESILGQYEATCCMLEEALAHERHKTDTLLQALSNCVEDD